LASLSVTKEPLPTMTTVGEDVALAALVDRAKAGDRNAAEQLVAHLRPRVFRYVLARVIDPHLADDVTQEVTVAMLTALPRHVDQGRPFGAWVFGIASNKISETRRSAVRRRETTTEMLPERVADTSHEPETAMLRQETTRYVAALLDRLPPTQAEILRLRIAAGLSADETAEVLGMTAGAVRVAQHRALGRLRELMREVPA
jgi:RNA polymerase sigma-70 factor (ECF subfamily)